MGNIILKGNVTANVTVVSNYFLDEFMPKANGEFVKIYLYLLRISNSAVTADKALSVCKIADTFNHTEKDVLRALKYWEEAGLLSLTYDNGNITAICLEDLKSDKYVSFIVNDANSEQDIPAADLPAKASGSESSSAAKSTSQNSPSEQKSEDRIKTVGKARISPDTDKLRELADNDEIKQLLYIVQTYLKKTLSPSDTDTILYFYDTLGFSSELIEYLIEYCVTNNHRTIRYIESVALSWAEAGVTTIADAKSYAGNYSEKYFSIMKALGITGRNIAHSEKLYIDKWTDDYGFSNDMILEACNRTIVNTHQASFPYTDTILTTWKNNGIRTLKDIEGNDKLYYNPKKKAQAPVQIPVRSKNAFSNYNQRSYDYGKLEKNLLNRN